jgi:glucokinase-like ROK family protein
VRFNGEGNYVLGIDLGTTAIRGAVANLNAEILAETSVPTEVEAGAEAVIERVASVITELMDSNKVQRSRILGVGMAVAGLINRQENTVAFSPDFNWRDVDIHTPLAQRFDIPIIFDNVTRVMALGELWYGVGSEIKNFICVNVAYGIGAGIILEGRPLYGSEGMAGEFGHVTLENQSSAQCKCGNVGCLEALSSGRAIAQAAQRELAAGRRSSLTGMCDGRIDEVTAKMVIEAARAGDELAAEVFERAVDYLGVGIAGLINLFNPEAVVIGGGVAQAGDILFDRLNETVRKRVMSRHADSVKLLPVTHGMNATVRGAVSLVLNKVLTFSLQT